MDVSDHFHALAALPPAKREKIPCLYRDRGTYTKMLAVINVFN